MALNSGDCQIRFYFDILIQLLSCENQEKTLDLEADYIVAVSLARVVLRYCQCKDCSKII